MSNNRLNITINMNNILIRNMIRKQQYLHALNNIKNTTEYISIQQNI